MTANTDPDTVLQPAPSVVYRDLDESAGGVLLHLDTGGYFALNTTGREVWALLDGVRPLRQVAKRLRQAHPDAGTELTADLDGFVSDIVERGLAVPIGSPTT